MQISIIIGIVISLLAVSPQESGFALPVEFMLPGGSGVLASLCRAGLLVVIYWLWLYLSTRSCLIRMAQTGKCRPDRTLRLSRLLTVITTAFIVLAGGWDTITAACPIIGLQELTAVAPFVALLTVELLLCYKLDIIMRGGGYFPDPPDPNSPANPVWSRGEYLTYNLRHNLLIILVPMLLISLFEGICGRLVVKFSPELGHYADFILENEIISLVGVLLIFVLAGPLLSCIWKTSPLAAGPLRAEMEAFCRAVKLPYRDILVWHTHGMTANAAITGIFGPLRYIIVSDRLLATMSTAQLTAVFGHEAGHIRLKHIPLLFATVFALTGCGSQIIDRIVMLIPEDIPAVYLESISLALVAIVTYGGFLLFGFISRNFERQADVFAAKAVGQLETFRPGIENQPDNGKLSVTGSAIMSSALNRLAVTNGISTNKKSWRHGSLADRMALLYELAVTPKALANFQRKLRLINLAIIIMLIVTLYNAMVGM